MGKMKSFRIANLLILSFFKCICSYSQPTEKLWDTDSSLKVPASVLFDAKNERLYVSNIDGKNAWAKDRKGSIALLTPAGKILNGQWVSGLHAPKGLALFQDFLIVADIDSVVLIETTRAAVVKKIYIPDAKELKDIALDKRGNIYVSDSKTGKIHMIGFTKLDVTDFVINLNYPTGICFAEKNLYFLDGDGFYRLGKNKEKELIANGFGENPEGVESIDEDTFIVSCLFGELWQVKVNGEKKLLIDSKITMVNASDLGFNKKTKVVYVPTYWKNHVSAYQLK